MRAAIVTVGDEVVGGFVVDTNCAYLAGRLTDLGIPVVLTQSVGDSCKAVVSALQHAFELADLVLVTGGLGATEDDITKEAISEFAGRSLAVDESLRRALEERYRGHTSATPEIIADLASVPEGAETLANPVGAAAGLRLKHREGLILVMPGVPREMTAIFEARIAPYLAALPRENHTRTGLVRTIGLAESEVVRHLAELLPGLGVGIGYLPGTTGVDVRITTLAGTAAAAGEVLVAARRRIAGRLGEYVYSEDHEDLHGVVGRLLIAEAVTIGVAESCTGGLIAHLLTQVPGISACLERAVVAYSNQAKIEMLSVEPRLLDEHGAVSAEVAQAMARGVRTRAGVDIGLSTTGVAGPGGGTAEKPVGLVYIGLVTGRDSSVVRHVFRGERAVVKERAAARALDMVRRELIERGG